jgi:hypothetical protein
MTRSEEVLSKPIGLILSRRSTYTPANLDHCMRMDLALIATDLGSPRCVWFREEPWRSGELKAYATKKRLRNEIDALVASPTFRRSQLRLITTKESA